MKKYQIIKVEQKEPGGEFTKIPVEGESFNDKDTTIKRLYELWYACTTKNQRNSSFCPINFMIEDKS